MAAERISFGSIDCLGMGCCVLSDGTLLVGLICDGGVKLLKSLARRQIWIAPHVRLRQGWTYHFPVLNIVYAIIVPHTSLSLLGCRNEQVYKVSQILYVDVAPDVLPVVEFKGMFQIYCRLCDLRCLNTSPVAWPSTHAIDQRADDQSCLYCIRWL